MKRKIWIMNHYATAMYFNKGGRHYWFAENLIRQGYEPTIFCANTRHSSDDFIEINNGKIHIITDNKIPFIFVKTTHYKGNGKSRIINMVSFYKNLFHAAKEYAKINGKPDIIIASSVHPLTLVAGIKIAKKFNIPCICEVRDLWPESIVVYRNLKPNSLMAKVLYQGEKWIYKKADKLIFTMEGGKDYIIERGWDKEQGGPIDIKKVHHINNGVDLEIFNYNKEHYQLEDEDLSNPNTFKVIYTGSIRLVNKVEMLVDVAKNLNEENVKLLIWGDGDQVKSIENRIKNEKIDNIILKGKVDKKYIPYITSKADINIIPGTSNPLYKYGVSLNKMFDYFASGKPVLSTKSYGYSPIKRYSAGIELENSSVENIAKTILEFKSISKNEYKQMCENAKKAACDYSFKNLTNELIKIIEN